MKAMKQMMTGLVALSLVGILGGCQAHPSTPETKASSSTSAVTALASTSVAAASDSVTADVAQVMSNTQPVSSTPAAESGVRSGHVISDPQQSQWQPVPAKSAPEATTTSESPIAQSEQAPAGSAEEISTASQSGVANSSTTDSIAVSEAKVAFQAVTKHAYTPELGYMVWTEQLDPTTVQIEVRHDNPEGEVTNLVHLYQYHTETGALLVMEPISGQWEVATD